VRIGILQTAHQFRTTKIVQNDLAECDDEQVAAFKKYAVEPYPAPIRRHGKMDRVVVIARNRDEAIYWEDVEEGFNLSTVSHDGTILEHWCNQDELRFAFNAWIEGRERPVRVGPAISIE